MRGVAAAVYFILQLGYFNARKQFFLFGLHEVSDDVLYVLRRYFPEAKKLPTVIISKPTRLAQQARILKLLDHQPCSQVWKGKLQSKAQELVIIQSKPIYVFKGLVTYLEHHRVVLAGYSIMQLIVGKAMTTEQRRLEQAVSQGIPEPEREKFDRLLTAEENLYQLTLLKHEPKDFSHQEVAKEVAKRNTLATMYQVAHRFLPTLGISHENIIYYASLVGYYTVQKLEQLHRDTRHAYLLCFIFYRYQIVNDNLVNTFVHHVQKFIEAAQKQAREQMAGERLEANKSLKQAGRILNLFTDEAIPDETYFGTVKCRAFAILRKDQFALVSNYLTKAVQDETAYEWRQYVRLAARFKLNLRHLMVAIPFASQRKDDPLLTAVAFLKAAFTREKSLRDFSTRTLPTACIPERLRKYLYEVREVPWYGKTRQRRLLNVDKYEFFIYRFLKKGIEDGHISIRDSCGFKSLEEDLIGEELWKQKDVLIQSLSTPYLEEPIDRVLAKKEAELEARIRQVNDRIKRHENQAIKITGTGANQRWHLIYCSDDEPMDHPIFSRLPQIGIGDVLRFVHRETGCFTPFTHLLSRYGKQEPQIPHLIGGMLALGENIGPYRMAEISDLSLQALLTTTRDFFRQETLGPANDLTTNAAAKLPAFKFYNIHGEILHGSMDGSKLDSQIETFNARHIPKYFGLGKGISSIALIVNHLAPNAKIIGTHEHESYFAYDILYNNTSDVDPRILSTDTHGINQVNHMILDVFGYQFSPRYVNLNSDTKDIYGFHDPAFYKDGIVRPSRRINTRLIIEEWDNILRILVSLSLKTTTQSTIIRKLSSHLRKNRTKKAMWEFDNIIKSIDKLRYIDSLLFRKHIQKALNRGDAYNKLRRAVFHDNGGKFRVRTELEQQIWSECTRFITNCIIYCNMYIQSALYEAALNAGRCEEAEAIKGASPVAWRHINLRGRFEFQKQTSMVDIDEIIKLVQKENGLQQHAVSPGIDGDPYFTFLRG